MAKKNQELHILIHTKFTSESECARELEKRFPEHHWSRAKLNKYTNGGLPGVFEINDLSLVLGRTVDDLIQIFLQQGSPKGDEAAWLLKTAVASKENTYDK